MGGGDNKIDETPEQKAFADVAMQKWQQYQSQYKPVQDRFMDDIKRRNSGDAYQQVANLASVPVENQFSQAVMQSASGMTGAGINPQSGLFQEEIKKLDRKKQQAKSDIVNQSQVSQQDRYTGGLQQVVAMGQGQQAEATAGLGDVASMANQRASNDAGLRAQNRFGNQQVVGGLVGAGTRYGLNQMDKGS